MTGWDFMCLTWEKLFCCGLNIDQAAIAYLYVRVLFSKLFLSLNENHEEQRSIVFSSNDLAYKKISKVFTDQLTFIQELKEARLNLAIEDARDFLTTSVAKSEFDQ